MSFWLYGRHACTQYSKCGLTRLLCKAMMFLFDLFSYVRLINPTILFALLTHIAMWWLGLSDWLITTSRSFSSVECAIFCAPIVYSCFGFAWPKCTHLHFPGLNSICHFPVQWNALARSYCSSVICSWLLTGAISFVWSANLRICDFIFLSMSLM